MNWHWLVWLEFSRVGTPELIWYRYTSAGTPSRSCSRCKFTSAVTPSCHGAGSLPTMSLTLILGSSALCVTAGFADINSDLVSSSTSPPFLLHFSLPSPLSSICPPFQPSFSSFSSSSSFFPCPAPFHSTPAGMP